MAAVPNEVVQAFLARESSVGPVTSARRRRTALIYTVMCLVGIIPMLTGMTASAKAAGLGLWIPGGGFLAVGGWAMLLFPLTVALFGLAVFLVWFGDGDCADYRLVWIGGFG